jgi:hypothetical protein
MRASWNYYTPRTDLTHGSSLAPASGHPRKPHGSWTWRIISPYAGGWWTSKIAPEHRAGIHGATAGGCGRLRVRLRRPTPDRQGITAAAAPSTLAAAAVQGVRGAARSASSCLTIIRSLRAYARLTDKTKPPFRRFLWLGTGSFDVDPSLRVGAQQLRRGGHFPARLEPFRSIYQENL